MLTLRKILGLLVLVTSQVYWPLLDGEVCLRGVKERVADASPLRSSLSLNHLYADVVTPCVAPPLIVQVSVY